MDRSIYFLILEFYIHYLLSQKNTNLHLSIVYNALVICKHGPYGAGDSGGTAGLKYGDFTFEVSRQCHGMAGLLIPAKTAGEIAGRFDRGLPVYSTVFYPNLGRVLKYRKIQDFEKKAKMAEESRRFRSKFIIR